MSIISLYERSESMRGHPADCCELLGEKKRERLIFVCRPGKEDQRNKALNKDHNLKNNMNKFISLILCE